MEVSYENIREDNECGRHNNWNIENDTNRDIQDSIMDENSDNFVNYLSTNFIIDSA